MDIYDRDCTKLRHRKKAACICRFKGMRHKVGDDFVRVFFVCLRHGNKLMRIVPSDWYYSRGQSERLRGMKE